MNKIKKYLEELFPIWFFAGLILGFLICALSGYCLSKENIFQNFVRFNLHISPSSQYFPNANQMLNLVKKNTTKDQIVVIIGGNSVLYGYGQEEKNLWSNQLNEKLGQKYKVFNYSFQGTAPFEGGYWVAEALFKQGYKVILVTNSAPAEICPPPGVNLRSVYFDFRNRNLLLQDKVRDDFVKDVDRQEGNLYLKDIEEKDLARKLDAMVYASDLWNWVSYNFFYTIWTSNNDLFLYPKKLLTEKKIYCEPPFKDAFDYDSDQIKIFQKEKMVWTDRSHWAPLPYAWIGFDNMAQRLVPVPMRKQSLVIITCQSPVLLKNFSMDEKKCTEMTYHWSALKWREFGYRAIVIGQGYQAQDFYDFKHLSDSGLSKMTDRLNVEVRDIAKELGYE